MAIRAGAGTGLAVLRVVLGLSFFYHGADKLFGSGPAAVIDMFGGMGIPVPAVTAWLAILIETLGGIALVLGVFTTPVAWVAAVEMLVALLLVHWPHGFSFINVTGMTEAGPQFGMPGWEVNLLYIGGFVCVALAGPGSWSLRLGGAEGEEG